MSSLMEIAFSNLIVASLLALLAALAGLWGRRPALTHALWLLVLLKLITPPLFHYPIHWPAPTVESGAAHEVSGVSAPLTPCAAPGRMDYRAGAAHEVSGVDPPPVVTEDRAVDPPQPAIVPVVEQVEPAPEAVEPLIAAQPVFANEMTLPEAIPEPDEDVTQSWTGTDIAMLVWPAGAIAWLALAGTRVWRFRRLLRFAEPAPEYVQSLAREIAERLHIRCPAVNLIPGNVSPMLWAFGRSPRLLLPAGLIERLSAEQLATLLAHELAHWRRRDDRVRWLEIAVLTLYWWCPLAWWARRELHQAEEECCDAWVVALLPDAAKSYALALVETVDFLSGAAPILPPAASGLGRVRLLKRRLTMILQGKTPKALSFTGLAGVVGIGLLLLPLVPGWAQNPGERAAQPDAKEAERLQAELDGINRERSDRDMKLAEHFERTGHPDTAYFYYDLVRRRSDGDDIAKRATKKIAELVGARKLSDTKWVQALQIERSRDAAMQKMHAKQKEIELLHEKLKSAHERQEAHRAEFNAYQKSLTAIENSLPGQNKGDAAKSVAMSPVDVMQFKMLHISGNEVAKMLKELDAIRQRVSAGAMQDPVRITWDDKSRTVFVQASPASLAEIRLLIDFLDRPRPGPNRPDPVVEFAAPAIGKSNFADQRLIDVERKLETLLQEMRVMRLEIMRGRKAPEGDPKSPPARRGGENPLPNPPNILFKPGAANIAPIPFAPNPPKELVRGKVEMVDAKDGMLVQIDLGTDQGVEKGHTLDVYRLHPEAKYLGVIRIVEAYNAKSVGRLVAVGNPALRAQLMVGDLVTSKIARGDAIQNPLPNPPNIDLTPRPLRP